MYTSRHKSRKHSLSTFSSKKNFLDIDKTFLKALSIRKVWHKIDLVVLPNSTDVHQDHQVINREGIRAFKHSSILGYELVWNNLILHLQYSRLN